jgi:hypothetical protein
MADDNQVDVRIVGDASGVAPAVETTKDEISGLTAAVQQMSSQFAELAAAITGSMQSGAASTAEMAGEMKELIAETEKESISLKELAVSAREGLESFAEMRESIMGIGELLMAVFAVEEIARFAESIGDAAEKTFHLSQQLGLSMGQVQGLAAAAAATGVPMDALTRGLGQLDLHLEKNPKLFADLGIQIPKNADQMTVLNAVMEHFNGMADGPNKTAEAMALMGRAGKELIPFLNEGSTGLADLIEKAKEYGAVNTDAAAKGVVLAESLNEGKLAMDGLKLTLSDAFAPLLTELVDGFNNLVKSMTESYNTGGAVKVVFEGIVEMFQGLGEIVAAVADGFSVMFSGTGSGAIDWAGVIKAVIDAVVIAIKVVIAIIVTLVEAVKIAFDAMVGQALDWYGQMATSFEQVGEVIDIIKIEFQTLGTVVMDALTLQWGSIAADWDAGMAQIDNVVKTRGKQIADDAKTYAQQAQSWFSSADAEGNKLAQYWAHAGDQQKPASTGIALPKTGNDAGGDLSSAGKKGKHQKEKDDLVQHLQEELTAKKLAWAMEQDAQGTAEAYSLQSEADYWKAILDRTDLSAKDRAAVETKYLAAHSQIVRERWAIEEDGYKRDLAEADKNEAAKLVIAQQHLVAVGAMFGAESKEYAAAQAEIVKIKQQAAQQLAQLEKIRADASNKADLDEITTAENLAKQRVALGLETNAQLLAQEQQFENQRYAIQLSAAQRDLSKVEPSKDPVKYAQLLAQIEALERAHQTKLTQIDQQAMLQRTQLERTAINSTAQLWSQNIAKMITLQQGFGATIKSLYDGMVNVISTALASIIEKWIEQQLAAFLLKRTAQTADGIASVTSNAGIAGAAAFASTAAIPIIGPELAPAAAAAAVAGAMSFAPMASAAGGFWQVPGDQIAAIHTDEMVLPAWAANPLRSLISGGAANNNQPAAANGGPSYHYHDHTERGVSAQGIIDNHVAVGKAFKLAHRKGLFAGTPLAG